MPHDERERHVGLEQVTSGNRIGDRQYVTSAEHRIADTVEGRKAPVVQGIIPVVVHFEGPAIAEPDHRNDIITVAGSAKGRSLPGSGSEVERQLLVVIGS